MLKNLRNWWYWNVSGPFSETYPNRIKDWYKEKLLKHFPFSGYGQRIISLIGNAPETKLLLFSPLETEIRTRGESQIYFHVKWSFGRLKLWKTIYLDSEGRPANLFMAQVTSMIGEEPMELSATVEKILDIPLWTSKDYSEALQKISQIPELGVASDAELYLKIRRAYEQEGLQKVLKHTEESELAFEISIYSNQQILRQHTELLKDPNHPNPDLFDLKDDSWGAFEDLKRSYMQSLSSSEIVEIHKERQKNSATSL